MSWSNNVRHDIPSFVRATSISCPHNTENSTHFELRMSSFVMISLCDSRFWLIQPGSFEVRAAQQLI